MTREDKRLEEIESAAEAFITFDLCETKYTEEQENLIVYYFASGAQWADNNSKSSWINVKEDLPCNHEELWVMTGGLIYTKKVLVVLTDNTVKLLSMLYDEVNDKWKWESKDNIIFWTPIPKLPKE